MVLKEPLDHSCRVLTGFSGFYHVRCFERIAPIELLPFLMLIVPSASARKPDRGAIEILRAWKEDQLQRIARKQFDLKHELIFDWAKSHHRTSAEFYTEMPEAEITGICAQLEQMLASRRRLPENDITLLSFVVVQQTYLDFLRHCEERNHLMKSTRQIEEQFWASEFPVEWWDARQVFYARAEYEAETSTHKLSTALSL